MPHCWDRKACRSVDRGRGEVQEAGIRRKWGTGMEQNGRLQAAATGCTLSQSLLHPRDVIMHRGFIHRVSLCIALITLELWSMTSPMSWHMVSSIGLTDRKGYLSTGKGTRKSPDQIRDNYTPLATSC